MDAGRWRTEDQRAERWRTEVRRSDMGESGEHRADMGGGDGAPVSVRGASASALPIISTFTSAQEREALRRALAKGRAII